MLVDHTGRRQEQALVPRHIPRSPQATTARTCPPGQVQSASDLAKAPVIAARQGSAGIWETLTRIPEV
jgi:hypothetical protein